MDSLIKKLLLGLALGLLGAVTSAAQGTITVNPASTHQTMSAAGSFGAAAAFQCNTDEFSPCNVWTAQQADWLYCSTPFTGTVCANNGIGLSMLRVMIYEDSAFPFTNNINQAKARNSSVRVWLAPWTAPAAYKSNSSLFNGGYLCNGGANGLGSSDQGFCGGTNHYQDWATYLSNYINTVQTNSNISVYAISVQNEPNISPSYRSMLWTAAQFDVFVRFYLGPTMATNNPGVKIIIPETSTWTSGAPSLAATCQADSQCNQYVQIIAEHGYSQPSPAANTVLAGQQSWETEDSDLGTNDTSMGNALSWATTVHNYLVGGNVNMWSWWWGVDEGDGTGQGLITAGTAEHRLWALGNKSNFIKAGATRIDATCTVSCPGITVDAFKNVDGSVALTVINTSGNWTATVNGIPANIPTMTPYVTSATQNLAAGAAISVSGGSFSGPTTGSTITTFFGAPTGVTIALPTFNPPAGPYATAQTVAITTTTSGSVICYTTDGSAPAATTPGTCSAGTQIANGGTVSVATATMLRAIGTGVGNTNSLSGGNEGICLPNAGCSYSFYEIGPVAPAPTISPAAGSYATTQSVTLTDTAPVICYNTSGNPQTNGIGGCTFGTKYTGPISVPVTTTIYAIAGGSGFQDSATVSTSTFTIGSFAATPVFSPAFGVFPSTQSVTITDTTPGSSIRYTTDGSTPTGTSTLYSGPITVSASQTINAIAIASGFSNSPVGSGFYIIGVDAVISATPGWNMVPGTAPCGGPENTTLAVPDNFPTNLNAAYEPYTTGTSFAGACSPGYEDSNTAVVDTGRSRMIVFGGGHSQYWGNDLWSFEPGNIGTSRPVFIRLNNPADVSPSGRTPMFVPPGSFEPPGSYYSTGTFQGTGTLNTWSVLAACTYAPGCFPTTVSPGSTHTYNNLVVVPTTDELWEFGGALSPTGFPAAFTWTLKLSSVLQSCAPTAANPAGCNPQWTQWVNAINPLTPAATGTNYFQYDPNSGLIFGVVAGTGGSAMWAFNRTSAQIGNVPANAWLGKGTVPSVSSGYHNYSVMDPYHKLFVTIGPDCNGGTSSSCPNGSGGIYYVDLTNVATATNASPLAYVTAGTTNCGALLNGFNGHYPTYEGVVWDPIARQIVVYPNGGTKLWFIDPTNWTCTSETYGTNQLQLVCGSILDSDSASGCGSSTAYSATYSYAIGDMIRANGVGHSGWLYYTSLQAANLGHTPPATATSNAFWSFTPPPFTNAAPPNTSFINGDTGTFGHFSYIPGYDIFVLCNTPGENCWYLRRRR